MTPTRKSSRRSFRRCRHTGRCRQRLPSYANAGFRLFTLTDNLLEVQTRQLEHGGIVDLFERRFSADGVKHHKPSRQAYAYVERQLGVEPSQLCLIACHTWDTLGAVAAGWEAALIKRVGNDILGLALSRRSLEMT